MPAMGAFTGGLNVLDEAFGKVFVLSGGSLLGDVPRGAQWKL